jgi:flagellar assembly protein FliH
MAAHAEFEARLAEETRRSFEAGRERGNQEGRQAETQAQAATQKNTEQQRLRQHAQLVAGFAEERDRYLQAIEREVVRLALAVAARILRREAQMDPLLLTGAVRVALGQLSGSTEVRLRVPQDDVALWSDAMALLPNLALKPTVVAAEGMRLGDCVIETSIGSVDLGIRSQLGEIERGFFDRATVGRAAPGSEPAAANPSANGEGR